ncbi:DUF4190 domain-containing protein [Streptomyces sp. NPDC101149]|uniref:DUF4190 domain-containing protein n=1 Tax=Streptomyces sp. NPDC101149 TaxID=3366113 RepID=UPI0038074127
MSIPPPPGPPQPGGQHPQGPYQQPYGPGSPYRPWGQGYSPYNRPAPVNGPAIAALVLGFLCFLPGVGLVLGLVALAQIKRRAERGRGLAVGGIVMSSLGLALIVLAFATGGVRDFREGLEKGARGTPGAGVTFSMVKGECYNAPNGSLGSDTYDWGKVPCDGVHQAEIFANFGLPEGDYPGDARVDETAGDKCYALEGSYAMDTWAVPDDVDVYYVTPSRETWASGDREASACSATSTRRPPSPAPCAATPRPCPPISSPICGPTPSCTTHSTALPTPSTWRTTCRVTRSGRAG